ncbi:MAG: c-type cytochrome, partial [Gammaproteobacteria bacterium]|nr:c-type cytochrome [Gammaproteobacteria bacterium]
MAFAVALILLVIGSVAFHFLSPWWLTPLASNWGAIDFTINLTFWVTGIVFVAVNLFMAYAVIRYRYKEGVRAHYEPENAKLENWLIGITTVGVVAMLAPGLFVWAQFVEVPEDASEFEVVGQQWHWSYRFPGEDGVMGTTDARLMTDENPFGMNPEDPNGQDDVLIFNSEVHLPLDVPVKVLLRAKDVLHDFAVPQFRVKMDMVPGLVSYVWLTPTRPGTFDILCMELCGIAHFTMRGKVVVETQEEFDTWLASNPTYAEHAAKTPGDAQAGRALYAICSACHGVQGEGNAALNSPKIAGQSAWYMKRQIQYYRSGVRGSHPGDTYGRQMAPMALTLANEAAIDNVIAYVQTLPDNAPEATVAGDVEHGERLFAVCANCHGHEGQGIQALNAPRQAGMSDWYLVTQLQNFKARIRGSHDKDMYGIQMQLMADVLHD